MTDKLQTIWEKAKGLIDPRWQVVHDIPNYEASYTQRDDCTLHVMPPTNLHNLFVALHEVGHIMSHDKSNRIEKIGPWVVGKHWYGNLHKECLASKWAKDFMTANGLTVPDDIWKEAKHHWEEDEKLRHEMQGDI